MSKTLDYLKSIQRNRENVYSSANHTSLNTKTDSPGEAIAQSKSGNRRVIATSKIFYTLVFLLFFINLSLNFSLFTRIKGNQVEKNKIIAKLNQIENLLSDNTKQISSLSASMKEHNRDTNAKITELEKDQNNQSFAIATLTKAKDLLLRRISELENKAVSN